MLEVTYRMFMGCVIPNRLPFIEASSRKALTKLGLELEDLPGATCCPDPVGGQSMDHLSWLAIGARNLAIAEDLGCDLVSPCNGCVETLKSVNYFVGEDEHEHEKINELLALVNKSYSGRTKVKHLIELLHDDFGLEKVREAVTKPLDGLKVACHYGCHYSRPSSVVRGEDPFHPEKLDNLVAALGATPVEYDEKALCCGNATSKTEDEPAIAVGLAKFESIAASGADCIAVICPACFLQLDTYQAIVNRKYQTEFKIPVLYYTELLALALGVDPDSIGLNFHRVKPGKVLELLK
ncbi:MAG: CoB--CoM heterodisulfide reductase subunit B [Promethearchaeota archaeon]